MTTRLYSRFVLIWSRFVRNRGAEFEICQSNTEERTLRKAKPPFDKFDQRPDWAQSGRIVNAEWWFVFTQDAARQEIHLAGDSPLHPEYNRAVQQDEWISSYPR
jgi:hypothetical protein